MSFDEYIPDGHKSNSLPASKLYGKALEELIITVPSVRTRTFDSFDRASGGFRPREFSILCGGTGVGKTTFIANLSASLLRQQVPHFVASVETGPTDYIKRVLSVLANQDLNHGDAIKGEVVRDIHIAHGASFTTDNLHLSLYEDRFSVETLMADIAFHVKAHHIKVAIIDNLNFFLDVTSAEDSMVEMDRVIHQLIIFCKRIDVHVIMVMHPKKTQDGRVESEFDVKGSSTAVQESHNVFLLNRAHPDRIEAKLCGPFDRELKIAKMRRRGRAVGRTIVLKSTNGVTYEEGVTL